MKLLLVTLIALSASAAVGAPPNAFFAMDTIARGGPEVVVPLLKELGYAGLGGQAGDAAMAAALKAESLELFNGYLTLSFDEAQPALDDRLRGVLDRMQGHDAVLWLALQKVQKGGMPFAKSSSEADDLALSKLKEIADYAITKRVRIALYPHTGMWIEHGEDALRVADKLNRPDVGVTFNLCHWLKVEGAERDPLPVLKAALPRLMFVTISGADNGDTKTMGWDRLIQPLGSGSYDVDAFMQDLHTAGYQGPVGFQGFGIKQEPREVLKQTMDAWRGYLIDPPYGPYQTKEVPPWKVAGAREETLRQLSSILPVKGDRKEHVRKGDGPYVLWGELFETNRCCAVVVLVGNSSASPGVGVADWARDHWEFQSALALRPVWRTGGPSDKYLPDDMPEKPFWVSKLKDNWPPLLTTATVHGKYHAGRYVLAYDRSAHHLRPEINYSVTEPSIRGGLLVLTNCSPRKADWEQQSFYEVRKDQLIFRAALDHDLNLHSNKESTTITTPSADGGVRREWTFDWSDDSSPSAVSVKPVGKEKPEQEGTFEYKMGEGENGLDGEAYAFEKLTGIPRKMVQQGTVRPDAKKGAQFDEPAEVKVTGAPEIVSKLSYKAPRRLHLFGR